MLPVNKITPSEEPKGYTSSNMCSTLVREPCSAFRTFNHQLFSSRDSKFQTALRTRNDEIAPNRCQFAVPLLDDCTVAIGGFLVVTVPSFPNKPSRNSNDERPEDGRSVRKVRPKASQGKKGAHYSTDDVAPNRMFWKCLLQSPVVCSAYLLLLFLPQGLGSFLVFLFLFTSPSDLFAFRRSARLKDSTIAPSPTICWTTETANSGVHRNHSLPLRNSNSFL